MLKKDFLEELSQIWNMPKKEVESKVNSLFHLMTEVLSKKEPLSWLGFGRFYVREKMARIGRNPLTGKTVHIPEKVVPAFKASKKLKALVQKGGSDKIMKV